MRALIAPGQSVALDRHQQRRDAGLPTISVLLGSRDLADHEVCSWARAWGRPVVRVTEPTLDAMTEAWVDTLIAGRDLSQDAAVWISALQRDPAVPLGAWIGRMSLLERRTLIDSLPLAESAMSVAAMCRALILDGEPGRASSAKTLSAVLGETPGMGDEGYRHRRLISALRELVPRVQHPILFVGPRDGETEREGWTVSAAESLTRLALDQPSLSLTLSMETVDLDRYLEVGPDSRAKALVRTGLIPIWERKGDEIDRADERDHQPSTEEIGDSIQRLVSDGASDQLVRLFRDAVRAAEGTERSNSEVNERARSAAELFLFERLESLPETGGVFTMNATLDFRFGPSRAIEVDLASRALRLAIEIDGYYHFQDADAYRRDRRKDLVLQQHGYLVVRVLVEDVVTRLEDVLELIISVVASRRDSYNLPRDETS